MSKGKKRPLCAPWERMPGQKHFTRLYDSYIDSAAFISLEFRQQMLLIRIMQRCTFIPHDDGTYDSNNGKIEFPMKEWEQQYGVSHDSRIWKRDWKALEEHGFIKIMVVGKNQHTPSKYRLISDWQTWKGPPRAKTIRNPTGKNRKTVQEPSVALPEEAKENDE